MSTEPPPVPLAYTTGDLSRLLGAEWPRHLWNAYRWMLFARALDERMTALQRQGRVGFYGAATGQEAVSVAAGLVTRPEDWIFPGLREQLIALVRGHPIQTYVHHLFADAEDPSRGRQMPCHPTAREVRYVSMSSCVGTQITHAVGCAFAIQRRREPAVAVAFFGDGGTSVSDFHAGLNFASVFRLPVVFCCTNNQWAISQPVERQSRVAELAQKGAAYGIPGTRVDGTDLIAVYHELASALDRARSGEGPSLLEFVLYRMTPHSSSDDPTRYQPADWTDRARAHDPVRRMEALLGTLGLLSEDVQREVVRLLDSSIRDAIAIAEKTPPPDPGTLVRDVWAEPRADPIALTEVRAGE
jgi:pyruvate dehydrogenase E1 component alpha subunit